MIFKYFQRNKFRGQMIKDLKIVSTLLQSGVTFFEAFSVLVENGSSNHGLYQNVYSAIQEGKGTVQCLEIDMPWLKVYERVILEKQENAGRLNFGIQKVIEMDVKMKSIKNKMMFALIYPAIIAFVSAALFIGVLLFVIPKLRPLLLGGKTIPTSTKIMLYMSAHVWWLIIAFICLVLLLSIALIWPFRFGKKTRDLIIEHVLRAPIIKGFSNRFINNYWNSLGLELSAELLSSGQLISEVFQTVSNLITIRGLSLYYLEISEQLGIGKKLSEVIAVNAQESFWLPIIKAGENTGTLTHALKSISAIHEEKFSNSIETVNRLVEPVFMALIGLGVGLLAVSIITPLYSLMNYSVK